VVPVSPRPSPLTTVIWWIILLLFTGSEMCFGKVQGLPSYLFFSLLPSTSWCSLTSIPHWFHVLSQHLSPWLGPPHCFFTKELIQVTFDSSYDYGSKLDSYLERAGAYFKRWVLKQLNRSQCGVNWHQNRGFARQPLRKDSFSSGGTHLGIMSLQGYPFTYLQKANEKTET
jgi:hypothetical protein